MVSRPRGCKPRSPWSRIRNDGERHGICRTPEPPAVASEATVMTVEAVRTGWPADFPVDGRFRPGAPRESGSAHRGAAGKKGTSNLFGLRPPRGRAWSHNEGGGSGDRPPTGTGRASWLAARSSRFRWWSWPGAPPTGRGGGAHDLAHQPDFPPE
jgi:hypothetical protein